MSNAAGPELTKNQIAAAFIVAALTDLIQVPITLGEASVVGAPVAALFDFVLDAIVCFVMTRLIGFHWLLLPTFLVEAVPGLDVLPTWLGCVALVVRQRKKEEQARQQTMPPVLPADSVIDISTDRDPRNESVNGAPRRSPPHPRC